MRVDPVCTQYVLLQKKDVSDYGRKEHHAGNIYFEAVF